MLHRAAAKALRRGFSAGRSGTCFAPTLRPLSSATGTAGKSSASGAAATSGDRVNEQDVKAVADKAGAAGGKIAGAKSAGRPRKHLPHTGTEGAAPWSAATAGSDPTSIGRGEAAGSAGRGGNIDQNVSFSEEQGQGGSLRGGVASARAAATPGPDQADLIDYDIVGPDVATANEQQQQGSAAAPAAGGKTGKSSRKSSRAQDAAASVGGNIGQPMGPVVSSAGVRRGGGAAGGGGSGSGAGGGAEGVRRFHTASLARLLSARLPIGSHPVHNFSLTQARAASDSDATASVAAPGREAADEAAAVGMREAAAAHDAAVLQDIESEIAEAPPGTAMWTLRIAQADASASNPRAFLADAPDIIRSICLRENHDASSSSSSNSSSSGLSSNDMNVEVSRRGDASTDDATLVGTAGAVNLDSGDPGADEAAAALSVRHGAAAVAAAMTNPVTAVVPRLDSVHSLLQTSDGNLYEVRETAWAQSHAGRGAGYDSPPASGWVPPGKGGPAGGYEGTVPPAVDDPEWHISVYARKQLADAGLDPDTGKLPARDLSPQTTHANFVTSDLVNPPGPTAGTGGSPSGGVSPNGHGLLGRGLQARGYHTHAAARLSATAATAAGTDSQRPPEDVLYGETDAPAKTKDKVCRYGPPISAAKHDKEDAVEDDPPEVSKEPARMTATIHPRRSGLPPNTPADEVQRDAAGKPLAPGQQPTVDAAALAEAESNAPNVRAALGAEKVQVAAGPREGAGAPDEARQIDKWEPAHSQPPRR